MPGYDWDTLGGFATSLAAGGEPGGEGQTFGGGGASSGWGLSDLFGGMFGGFKDLAKEILPIALPAIIGGATNMLFPGEKPKIVGTDVRTGAGQGAEQIRLNAAGGLGASLQDPFAGLTGEEQYQIKRTSRAADAARGMLETGGSAERENQQMRLAVAQRRQQNLGNLNAFTSGYQPQNVTPMAGQENPWAKLITGVAGSKQAQQGFGKLIDKWWA